MALKPIPTLAVTFANSQTQKAFLYLSDDQRLPMLYTARMTGGMEDAASSHHFSQG